MSGPWCIKCGHGSEYHKMTGCFHDSGMRDGHRQWCDCDGYEPFLDTRKEEAHDCTPHDIDGRGSL